MIFGKNDMSSMFLVVVFFKCNRLFGDRHDEDRINLN